MLLPVALRGRSEIVQALTREALRQRGLVEVLYGEAGTGKSSIALAVAQAFEASGGEVWWITCQDEESVRRAFWWLARKHLQVDRESLNPADASALADAIWESLRRIPPKKRLIVLDQADDPESVLAASDHFKDGRGWIRSGWPGSTLVTSRNGLRATWGQSVRLREALSLPTDDAAQVLCDLAPNAGAFAEAQKLAAVLGCLPLALQLVGDHLGSPVTAVSTFKAYQSKIGNNFGGALRSSAEHLRESKGARSRVVSVEETIESSLGSLKSKASTVSARTVLYILSSLAPSEPIPISMLADSVVGAAYGSKEAAAADSIRNLAALGLIRLVDAGPVLGRAAMVHPLVSRIMWEQMQRLKNEPIPRWRRPRTVVDARMPPALAIRCLRPFMSLVGRSRPLIPEVTLGYSIDNEPITMIQMAPNADFDGPTDTTHEEQTHEAYRSLAAHVTKFLVYEEDLDDSDFALALRCAGECLGTFLTVGAATKILLGIVYRRLEQKNGRTAMNEMLHINHAYPDERSSKQEGAQFFNMCRLV